MTIAPFPDAYVIPNDIKALVKGENSEANFMDMLLKLAPIRARLNPKTYYESFSTKLFLEEESCSSKKFDRFQRFFRNIRIEHFYSNQFRFKITVSIPFHSKTSNFLRTLHSLSLYLFFSGSNEILEQEIG